MTLVSKKDDNPVLTKEALVSSVNAEKSSAIARHHRILIVDDEVDIVTVYQSGLNRDGFEVKGYSDPEEALLNFEPGAYDLAILDIRMPKMNGFELCREIKKRDEKIKIFFMTAFEIQLSEFEKVLPSTKVDGFIKKPIRIADLRSTVQKLVANSNDRDDKT
jgi:DNA-binding response OmpR family regulator